MSRVSAVMASPTTATPGAAFGGVPSAPTPLQPTTARGSVTAPMASTRRRVASRAIVHLPLSGRPLHRAYQHATPGSPRRPVNRHAWPRRPVPAGPPLTAGPTARPGTSALTRSTCPQGPATLVAGRQQHRSRGEEVVMHGDSRHVQSRPRRDQGRSAGGAGAERARATGPLPEPADLARVLEPVVRAAGMDLESVRISPAGRRRLLKLVVDADGGAALDQIAEVSREASVRLDASGVMGEVPYTLEVSSPGVDRPLTEPRHWRRAQGRLVSAPLAVG